jgi:hypothetical protein
MSNNMTYSTKLTSIGFALIAVSIGGYLYVNTQIEFVTLIFMLIPIFMLSLYIFTIKFEISNGELVKKSFGRVLVKSSLKDLTLLKFGKYKIKEVVNKNNTPFFISFLPTKEKSSLLDDLIQQGSENIDEVELKKAVTNTSAFLNVLLCIFGLLTGASILYSKTVSDYLEIPQKNQETYIEGTLKTLSLNRDIVLEIESDDNKYILTYRAGASESLYTQLREYKDKNIILSVNDKKGFLSHNLNTRYFHVWGIDSGKINIASSDEIVNNWNNTKYFLYPLLLAVFIILFSAMSLRKNTKRLKN